jgi:essential nuclear protein 1
VLLKDVRNFTAREAVIIGSVISKISIPVLHSAAALYKILDEIAYHQWTPSVSIIVSAIIGKKYALPVKVIDKVISWYLSFIDSTMELPVIWNIGLLVFVQIYKLEIRNKQQVSDELIKLLEKKGHKEVKLEIKRELLAMIE